MNVSINEQAKTLQLWIFTDKEAVTPRYGPKSFDIESQINTFVKVVSQENKNDANTLLVYQQTFFNSGVFESKKTSTYKLNIPENGVYLFLIEGEIEVNNQTLSPKDAIGITNFNEFDIVVKQKSKYF